MKNIYLKIIYKILASYARKVLRKHNPIIIAVTGSVGKTSTKEAIFQVLSDEYPEKVRKNYGNLNAEIGVPLTVLGYEKLPNKFLWPIFLILAWFKTSPREYPEYLILELGIEKAGDMKYLTSIAKPDYAVITSTAPAHIVYFKDIGIYQNEKLAIISSLKESGKAVVNYDDTILNKQREDNIISFAIEKSADYIATDIKTSLSGTDFRVVCTGYKVAVKSKLLGKHLIYSQLAAFAIADLVGVSRLKIGKSLERIKPIPGRMNLIDGKNNTVIIDDTYNSCNPSSVKAAINLISSIENNSRKVVILGSMNELGKSSKEAHEEVGAYLKDKCDFAVFVGPNATLMARAYGDKKSCTVFSDRNSLIDALPNIINEKDLILVKASQNGNYFEEVTKAWMKNPKDADRLLVRQGKFWKNKK